MKSREEEMTAKVHELQAQLEDLQKVHKQRIAEEEHCNSEKVSWPWHLFLYLLSVKILVHTNFCSLFLIWLYLYICPSLSHTKWISLESVVFDTTFLIGILKNVILLLLLRWGFFVLYMCLRWFYWKPFRRKENPMK